MFWMIVFAALFPIVLLTLPTHIVVLIFGMFIWSLYYELRGYSDFNFVHRFVAMEKHTVAWSVITTVASLAYTLGPVLAALLIKTYFNLSFIASVIIVSVGFIAFLIFFWGNKKHRYQPVAEHKEKTSFIKELRILGVLLKKMWLLVLFQIALVICDVTFWTTGILFADKLKATNELAAFIPAAFTMPSIFVGALASLIKTPIGKKRTAFIASLLGAISISAIMFTKNVIVILGLVLTCAVFLGVACILIYAVFADYIKRLGTMGNDMATLSQLAANLAYVLGPIVLGYIADKLGYEIPFGVAGGFLFAVALLALVFIPRKIHMPQKELEVVNSIV